MNRDGELGEGGLANPGLPGRWPLRQSLFVFASWQYCNDNRIKQTFRRRSVLLLVVYKNKLYTISRHRISARRKHICRATTYTSIKRGRVVSKQFSQQTQIYPHPGLGSLLYFSTSLQSKKVLGKSNEVQVKSTLLKKYFFVTKYKVLFNNFDHDDLKYDFEDNKQPK